MKARLYPVPSLSASTREKVADIRARAKPHAEFARAYVARASTVAATRSSNLLPSSYPRASFLPGVNSAGIGSFMSASSSSPSVRSQDGTALSTVPTEIMQAELARRSGRNSIGSGFRSCASDSFGGDNASGPQTSYISA
jgi:hypothetical protein